MCTERRLPRQRGVSLVEMIIFLVIVSIAVVALLGTMSRTTSASAEPLRRKQALMIAESLMEEVARARFTFCDADDPNVFTATASTDCTVGLVETVGQSGEARPYNHVNDYVTAFGAKQAAFNNGSGVLVDASGALYPSGYSATVRLDETALNGVAADASIKISIEVTDAVTRELVRLESFRLRYAPNSPP